MTYEEALELGAQVAKTLAKRFPPVEQDDIYQEIALELWAKRDKYLEMEPRLLNHALTQFGVQFCGHSVTGMTTASMAAHLKTSIKPPIAGSSSNHAAKMVSRESMNDL